MTNLELILKRFFAKYRAEHPDIQQIDLSGASADRDLPRKNARIVLTDNHTTPWDFNLPSATGSGAVISIYNQSDASVDVNPVGAQTINGANTAQSIATMETMAFVDYTSGKWVAILGGASSQSSEPLAIYIPMAGEPQANQCAVVWATNKPASTILEYKITGAAEYAPFYDDSEPANYTMYHEVTLTGLIVDTQYDLHIKSAIANPAEEDDEYLTAIVSTTGEVYIISKNIYASPGEGEHADKTTGSFAFTMGLGSSIAAQAAIDDYEMSNIAVNYDSAASYEKTEESITPPLLFTGAITDETYEPPV